ncbi:uncharacterized protein LOC128532151 [Clarias gariepinus]|uniref:uncharacterized protein LOC128532151 n=1 Tax=Clarias gariepinus TaxID=13013 RepID=UPI00234C17BB|nr:uncharacterized protein LOC128532151 [Clarias gariepinus]
MLIRGGKFSNCTMGKLTFGTLSLRFALLMILNCRVDVSGADLDKRNIFHALFTLTQNTLYPGCEVCIPHPVSVSAGIAWSGHAISVCDTCALLHINVSEFNITTCHNVTQAVATKCCSPGVDVCNQTYLPSHSITDVITLTKFPWCVENHVKDSPFMGEISGPLCTFIVELSKFQVKDISHISQVQPKVIAHSILDCVSKPGPWVNWLSINKFCRVPAPSGTYWLCGSTAYSELPARFNGRCSLIYLLPAMRPRHSNPKNQVTSKPNSTPQHVILIHRLPTDRSEINLDVPSSCGPVNCKEVECIWYKNGKVHTAIERGVQKVPPNAYLHDNGTLTLLPTKQGYQSFADSINQSEIPISVTDKLLSDIAFYSEVDAIFTFSSNEQKCPVSYQLHTRSYKENSPIKEISFAANDPRPCVEYFTCSQTFWSRSLGALIPNYGIMVSLDQIRILSHEIEKLANDTAQALGVISTTLQSHRMMILQNRVALDYILAQQGGTCAVVGPECCTDVFDPTLNLTHYIKNLEELRDRVIHIDQVNSDGLGAWLGSWWIYGREILLAFMVFLFILLLAYVAIRCCCLCVSKSVKHTQIAETTIILTPRPNAYI